jgi:hypothetical protein
MSGHTCIFCGKDPGQWSTFDECEGAEVVCWDCENTIVSAEIRKHRGSPAVELEVTTEAVVPVSRPAPAHLHGRETAVLNFVERSQSVPPFLLEGDLVRCPAHPEQICRAVSLETDCPQCGS